MIKTNANYKVVKIEKVKHLSFKIFFCYFDLWQHCKFSEPRVSDLNYVTDKNTFHKCYIGVIELK